MVLLERLLYSRGNTPRIPLLDEILEKGDQKMVKLSSWRKDPQIAGISNCVGDIGSPHRKHGSLYNRVAARKRCCGAGLLGQPRS